MLNQQLAASQESIQKAYGGSVQTNTLGQTQETIVEREFGHLIGLLSQLSLTMEEHTKRLGPVLIPSRLASAQSGEAKSPDEDFGMVGNNLRNASRQVEGVLAQFADLRYRLTV